jgi:hypothetical protein
MVPNLWVRFIGDDTWTLTAAFQGPWTYYTLEGPHPAPRWTKGDRDDQGPEHIMSIADERIRRHYGVD